MVYLNFIYNSSDIVNYINLSSFFKIIGMPVLKSFVFNDEDKMSYLREDEFDTEKEEFDQPINIIINQSNFNLPEHFNIITVCENVDGRADFIVNKKQNQVYYIPYNKNKEHNKAILKSTLHSLIDSVAAFANLLKSKDIISFNNSIELLKEIANIYVDNDIAETWYTSLRIIKDIDMGNPYYLNYFDKIHNAYNEVINKFNPKMYINNYYYEYVKLKLMFLTNKTAKLNCRKIIFPKSDVLNICEKAMNLTIKANRRFFYLVGEITQYYDTFTNLLIRDSFFRGAFLRDFESMYLIAMTYDKDDRENKRVKYYKKTVELNPYFYRGYYKIGTLTPVSDFENKFNNFFKVYSIIKRKLSIGYAEPMDIEYFIKSVSMLERLVKIGNLRENCYDLLLDLDSIMAFLPNNKFLIEYCDFWGLERKDMLFFINTIASNHYKKFFKNTQLEE